VPYGFVAIFFLLFVLLLYFQFVQYQTVKKEIATIHSGYYNADELHINTKTTTLPIISNYTSAKEINDQYLSSSPEHILFKIVDYSAATYFQSIMTKDALAKYKLEHPTLSFEGVSDEEILNVNEMAAKAAPHIILQNDQLSSQKTLHIVFEPKRANIWAFFLGKPRKTLTYIADVPYQNNEANQDEFLINRYISDKLHGALAEDMARGQEEQKKACPYWSFRSFDEEKIPLDFHILTVECSYFEQFLPAGVGDRLSFDGEQITVEIYTPSIEDGKRAFREALAKDGFKESGKLRVVYIHAPK
jgi:hypothetical protein